MTTTTITGKRRHQLTTDSMNISDDDNGELSNSTPQLANKRRGSAAADLASHRFIVSERQQLAVLKQLTAGDESNPGSQSSTSPNVQQRPTKIHRRNEHGETILHIAARKGDLKRLKKALNDGANVNEADNAGWTPLHEAVTKNQYKAANLLLKSGANSNATGPEDQTPIIDAVLNNNTKMVGLLLNYSADSSMVDLTRVNETMVKVLKREITTFDTSENENEDESSRSSSLHTSGDDSEHDEEKIDENLLQSSSLSKNQQTQSFQNFPEHSSDSLTNHKIFTMDSDLSRKDPYDFDSDDNDNEIITNSTQRTISGTSMDSNEIKNQNHCFKENSTSDDEHIHHNYRVPPLKIILARAVLHKTPDTESNHSSTMDENSTIETSILPTIEDNEQLLSTMMTPVDEVTTTLTVDEKNIPCSFDKHTSSLASINDEKVQSSHMIVMALLDDMITQIDALFDEQETNKKEKQSDFKIATRMLRSHVKNKSHLSTSNRISNNKRQISNRKRIFGEKPLRKKMLSERSQNNETSSNSDDQTIENLQEKIDRNEEMNVTGDDGSNSANLTINIKQNHTQPDIGSLPPNKRRLRERNVAILNATDTINSSLIEDSTLMETTTTTTREIPTNSIKQFLEIRQQIDKRHQAMLHDFVLPKVPKDFAETLMAKKSYLLSPTMKSFSITTPASLGIRRFNPPSDLDSHLSDVFIRQEDERYRMKLRHQVEREKLILSHEQEILRLYGNATRSSINQEIPFSYCSLLKDNEVYNNPSIQERHSTLMNNDYTNSELGKRGKNRWNGRSFIKWLEDSNLKYKRLSCEINQRQHLEANTLYAMQRMVWTKHLPKETSLSSSGRINTLLSERYLPKVEINAEFWTHWESNPI